MENRRLDHEENEVCCLVDNLPALQQQCTNAELLPLVHKSAMNLSNVIVFSAFSAALCFAGISIYTPEPDNGSGLVDAVVEILESCYGNGGTAVGLAGNSNGIISKAMWSRGNSQITLIGGTSIRIASKSPVHPQDRYKLQIFVVAAASPIALAETLGEVKTSIWWNHMASFLLLNVPNRECSNAFEMLWTAWEMNLLNAKFLCIRRDRLTLLYTYNPYTSQAPVPWQLEKMYSGKNDHPWTLYRREYSDGLCDELDFEKTNDLAGHEVRVSAISETWGHTGQSSGICVGLYDDMICETIFRALNATPKVLMHRSFNSVGYVDDEGNTSGILAEVANGVSEFGSSVRLVTSLANQPAAYPFWQSEINALTQYAGYKSQLSKIRSIIDNNCQCGLYLVCFLTILFFKYFVRQPIEIAHLSTLRIICNSTLPKIPGKVAARIYLGSLFLFALTIQGIYQGQLASLLARQEPLRNVETITDLTELGHIIYGPLGYRWYFSNPEFEDRFIVDDKVKCKEHVVRDSKFACVSDKSMLIYDAMELKLHLSEEAMATVFLTLPIQPDWPLEKRFNTLLMRANEANQIQYLYDNLTYWIYRRLEFEENENRHRRVKILTLEDLSFAFVILGIGLGCSTGIFIIEVGLRLVRLRIMKIN